VQQQLQQTVVQQQLQQTLRAAAAATGVYSISCNRRVQQQLQQTLVQQQLQQLQYNCSKESRSHLRLTLIDCHLRQISDISD
jgi:hypothetical protein